MIKINMLIFIHIRNENRGKRQVTIYKYTKTIRSNNKYILVRLEEITVLDGSECQTPPFLIYQMVPSPLYIFQAWWTVSSNRDTITLPLPPR